MSSTPQRDTRTHRPATGAALDSFRSKLYRGPPLIKYFTSYEELNDFISRFESRIRERINKMLLPDKYKERVLALTNDMIIQRMRDAYTSILSDPSDHVRFFAELVKRDTSFDNYLLALSRLIDEISGRSWYSAVELEQFLYEIMRMLMNHAVGSTNKGLVISLLDRHPLLTDIFEEGLHDHWKRLLSEIFEEHGTRLTPDPTLLFSLDDVGLDPEELLNSSSGHRLLSEEYGLSKLIPEAVKKLRENHGVSLRDNNVLNSLVSEPDESLRHYRRVLQHPKGYLALHPEIFPHLHENSERIKKFETLIKNHSELPLEALVWAIKNDIPYDPTFFEVVEKGGFKNPQSLFELYSQRRDVRDEIISIAKRYPDLIEDLYRLHRERPEYLRKAFLRAILESLEDSNEFREFILRAKNKVEELGLLPEEAWKLYNHSKRVGKDFEEYAAKIVELSKILPKEEAFRLSEMITGDPRLYDVLGDVEAIQRYMQIAGKEPTADAVLDVLKQRAGLYGLSVKQPMAKKPKSKLVIEHRELRRPEKLAEKLARYFNVVGGKVILRRPLMDFLETNNNVLKVESFVEKVKRKVGGDEGIVEELQRVIETKRAEMRRKRLGKFRR